MPAVTIEDVVKRYRGRGRFRRPSLRRSLHLPSLRQSLRSSLRRRPGSGDGSAGDVADGETDVGTNGTTADRPDAGAADPSPDAANRYPDATDSSAAPGASTDVVALDGVSMTLNRGEFCGLLGPNGSGKTTLFRLIAGLERPTFGTVSRPDATVGYSFQRPCFFEDLTVRENLRVFHSLQDDPPGWSWVEELIEGLRLAPADHRVAGDLSAGFATKLDLALAMLGRPTVLLLDEPFTDVDDYSRRQIRAFLAEYRTDDRSILVSTHNVEDFAPVLDRITVLLDGTVRYDGEPAGDALGQYREILDA